MTGIVRSGALSRDRLSGFAITAASILIAVFALWLLWSTVARWRAVSLLTSAQDRSFAGSGDRGRSLARDANAWEDSAPTRLLMIDPVGSEARERAEAALNRASGNERDAVAGIVAALGGTAEANDLAWLNAIAKAEATGDASWPTSAPSAPLWSMAVGALMRGAQANPTPQRIRTAVTTALLTWPRHPERESWRIFLAATANGAAADAVVLGNIGDGNYRARVQSWIWWFRPELMTEAGRSESGPPPDAPSTPGARLAWLRDAPELAAAPVLAAAVKRFDPSEQARAQLLAVERSGDAAAAAVLLKALNPTIVPRHREGDSAVFDLQISDGSAPAVSYTLIVNGVTLPVQAFERYANRYVISVPAGRAAAIELRIGSAVIAKGLIP